MKVSFSGVYHLLFQSNEAKNRVYKEYNQKLFNRIKALPIENLSYQPIVHDKGDKTLLILTNEDAKNFRTFSDLNRTDIQGLKVKEAPTIKDDLFEEKLLNSYLRKANKVNFSDISSIDLFA